MLTLVGPFFMLRKLFLFAVVLLLVACSSHEIEAPRPIEPAQVAVIYHQVKFSGETLGLISRWYTGSAENWRQIAAVNPEMRSEKIFLDQIIKIPRAIIRRDDPFTKSDLEKMRHSKKDEAPEMSVPSRLKEREGSPAVQSGGTVSSGGVEDSGELSRSVSLSEAVEKERVKKKTEKPHPKESSVADQTSGVKDSESVDEAERQAIREKTRYELLHGLIEKDSGTGASSN